MAMTEKIGKREGFGDVLADGIKVAWERLGRIGTEYAIHIQGEEVPAHDPKSMPNLATTYLLAATPARHTQGGGVWAPPPDEEKYVYSGQAGRQSQSVAMLEVVQAAGLCMFGFMVYPPQLVILDQLATVTGWEFDMGEVYRTGMRIFTMRHAFNLRQGHNPLARNVPSRLVGEPPLTAGPLEGVTVDYKSLNREFLELLGWDIHTTVPSEESLRALGMGFLVDDMAKVDVPAV